jgi:haloacetate dehalogenase
MYEATNLILAKIYWHWFFLVQPYPLPETFLLNSPEVLIRASFGGGGHALGSTPSAFHPDAVKSYEAMFRDSDGVHAMCEDYRAAASIDLEEQKEDINKERKIKCDVRVLWGGSGLVGRMFQPVEEWQKVSDGKVTGESVQCGHYIPEEAPDVVIKNTLEFFK